MANIMTTLKLIDSFSNQLRVVNQSIERTTRVANAMNAALHQNVRISVHGTDAIRELDAIKNRITGIASRGGAFRVLISAEDVIQNITRIRAQIQRQFSSATLNVSVNGARALAEARALKLQIQREIGTVEAQLNLHMPQSFMSVFNNLRRTMIRLMWMMRNMARNMPTAGAQQLEAALQRIATLERQIEGLQSRVNARICEGAHATGGWLSQVKQLAAAYLTVQSAIQLAKATVGEAFDQQRMQDMLIARSGSERFGKAFFQSLKQDALQAGQDVNETVTGALSFFSMTKNTDKIKELLNISKRLAMFDTTGQGLSGAIFSLKEVMSGDIVSLNERFAISKGMIRSTGLVEAGKNGDVSKVIEGMNKLLEMQNMGKKAFEKMLESPASKFKILTGNIKNMFADAGIGAMKALTPVIDVLNRAFANGEFKGFFDTLYVMLRIVAIGIGWLVDGFLWLIAVIRDNWEFIKLVLLALSVYLLTIIIPALWAMISPILMAVSSWLLLNAPILAVVGGVLMLLYMLSNVGVTAEDVLGFVGGLFMTLFAFIWNNVAIVWNRLVSFAEFLMNLFIDPVYAVQKLFYDLTVDVLKQFANMLRGAEGFGDGFARVVTDGINKVISGMEWLLKMMKKIPGFEDINASLERKEYTGVHTLSDGVNNMIKRMEKPTSTKAVHDLSHLKMEPKDYKQSYDVGKKWTTDAINGITDKVNGLMSQQDMQKQLELWNKGPGSKDLTFPSIDKVKKVGKVEDDINIADENLKMLRDLADMKNIQNFVTLQPSVTVTTGPITKDVDADAVIRKIEKSALAAMARSAEGVYKK